VSVGETPITIVGNLVDDPEMRFTPSGVALARFTIASTPRAFDKTTNQWKDGTALFMRCTAWRDLAEHTAESLTKGLRVLVTGRLVQNNWQNEQGENRSMLVMEVDEIGPSLRFANAKVTKTGRTANTGQPGDPWDTAQPAAAGGFGGPTTGDEPPF
jgi:single-strand DNA-binding protein